MTIFLEEIEKEVDESLKGIFCYLSYNKKRILIKAPNIKKAQEAKYVVQVNIGVAVPVKRKKKNVNKSKEGTETKELELKNGTQFTTKTSFSISSRNIVIFFCRWISVSDILRISCILLLILFNIWSGSSPFFKVSTNGAFVFLFQIPKKIVFKIHVLPPVKKVKRKIDQLQKTGYHITLDEAGKKAVLEGTTKEVQDVRKELENFVDNSLNINLSEMIMLH
jgi:hypothetical protein